MLAPTLFVERFLGRVLPDAVLSCKFLLAVDVRNRLLTINVNVFNNPHQEQFFRAYFYRPYLYSKKHWLYYKINLDSPKVFENSICQKSLFF